MIFIAKNIESLDIMVYNTSGYDERKSCFLCKESRWTVKTGDRGQLVSAFGAGGILPRGTPLTAYMSGGYPAIWVATRKSSSSHWSKGIFCFLNFFRRK